MRALRPKSPRQTTAALIEERAAGAETFYLRSAPVQNRASRLDATRRRYSAVDRMSSIGAISSTGLGWAASTVAPAASAASVRAARRTVDATLPRAIRGVSLLSPAITIFEIACAARVPTFRK